jgi:hypothetical protein
MKPIVAGLALVFGAAIAAPLAAQPPQAPQKEPAHKIYVLTGCLTGSGPVETAPFKLTGAAWVGQAPPERAAVSPDAKNVYELLPVSGLTEQGVARKEMQTHVGKRVEVKVRPVEILPGPSPSPSSTASTAKPQEAPPQRYTVTKINPLAGSCP